MPISPQDRDLMIRTVIGEADDQPDVGQAGVAHVILNRLGTGKWGDSASGVVLARNQFEPWSTRARELNGIKPDSPRYQKTAAIVDDVLSGQTPDPTGGATHFLQEDLVRKRRGGSLPDWASGGGQRIGGHTFYKPGEALEPDILAQYGIERTTPPTDDGGAILKGYGVTPKVAAPAKDIVDPGRMVVSPEGKVAYEPGDVTTRKEIAEGAKRGLPAQFIGGIPVAGPAINLGQAGLEAAVPQPGEEGKPYGERFSNRLNIQQRADKAFAQENPISSTAAQFAGGAAGYGAGAATAPGRLLLGMAGPTTAARIYGGTAGGLGIGAADSALRGEDPIAGGTVGAVGGFAGPTLGEGAHVLTRGAIGRATAPRTGPLANVTSHGLDLLTGRGLGDLTPAELQAARTMAGPHGFLGDLTPGLRDITQGVAAVQGPGKDEVQRAYEQRFAGSRGRLDDVLTRHFGPTNNIVDYKNFLTETRKAAADPLYEQWRTTQVHPTQELKDLIPRLESAGAFKAAEELAGIRGTNINRNFFTPGPQKAFPTTETWDLVKQGLDRRIDAAYSSSDKTLARHLVQLKGEMIGEIEKTPAGMIWRQARQEFGDRSALMDQMDAGRDTFLGGRAGTSVNELREELRHLSGPERAARIIGLRSALSEDMGATMTGDAKVGGKLLAPNNQNKIRLLLGDQRGGGLVQELEQERFLRERYPHVVGNPNTGASAVGRGETANLFRAPEALPWELTRPSTYPVVGRLMPQNVLHDLMVAGRARSAPALAPLLTTPEGPAMDNLLQEILRQRSRAAGATRAGAAADRLTAATVAGPASSTYRRYYENQKAE